MADPKKGLPVFMAPGRRPLSAMVQSPPSRIPSIMGDGSAMRSQMGIRARFDVGAASMTRSPTGISRSVSALSGTERTPSLSLGAQFPVLPCRADVQAARAQVDSDLHLIRTHIQSIQCQLRRLEDGYVAPAGEHGILQWRGVTIDRGTIERVLAENRKRRVVYQPRAAVHLRRAGDLPGWERNVTGLTPAIFYLFCVEMLQEREIALEANARLEAEAMRRQPFLERLDEYESKIAHAEKGEKFWPPEMPVEPPAEDIERQRWECARDQEMLLSPPDTLGCVEIGDAVAAHQRWCESVVWSDEEKDVFTRKYIQYPRNFRLIAAALPLKTLKQVIEYYYLVRDSTNLKALEREAQRRRPYGR